MNTRGKMNEQRGFLESMVRPQLMRTNQDLEHPSLAVVDHDNVFTVSFRYEPHGAGYVPDEVKWLVRQSIPGSNSLR